VTGRAAEKDRILALAEPGILQFRIVMTGADATDHSQPTGNIGLASAETIQDFVAADCTKQAPETGRAMAPKSAIAACDVNHRTKYLLDAAAVEGTALTEASAAQESTGGQNAVLTGNWQVDLSFNAAGAAEFAKLTQQLSQNMGVFAMVMDGTVYSSATVQMPITDGNARITGQFSKEQAESLAAMLKAGALPVRLTQTELDTYE
jgi:preprotein translocase subunit SecD